MAGSVETGIELIARLSKKESLEGRLEPTLFPDGPHHKAIIELYGEEGTGKTQMLVHLIANCILPKEWKHVSVGGLGIGVVFVDTDFQMSLIRLTSVLEARLLSCVKASNDAAPPCGDEVESVVRKSLEKLFIVRCKSSSELCVTLAYLENLFSSQPDVGVLMIDSISAFYWIDKYAGGDSTQAQEQNMTHIAGVLENLAKTHQLVIFATKSVMFQKSKHRDQQREAYQNSSSTRAQSEQSGQYSTEHCEYLCKAWTKIVTQRLIFSKESSKISPTQQQSFSIRCDASSDKTKLFFTINKTGISFLT